MRAARKLLNSRYAVALTGAGISVESGIPDFRSPEGLWSRYDPMEFGHIESFRANPTRVWEMLLEIDELLGKSVPNPAHFALAELEKRGLIKQIITQNVDSLHQRAGSNRVIEFHGHNRTLRCDSCGRRFPKDEVDFQQIPPLCPCGNALRPDIVFFGEMIPPEALRLAVAAAEECDFMMVVGTSATVAPASLLPLKAKEGGAFLLEINPSRTELSSAMSDLHIEEPAGKALPRIVEILSEEIQSKESERRS